MRALWILLLAGCAETLTTPEDIAARGQEGERYTARGTVFTLTFDNQMQSQDAYLLKDDRWILFRTRVPAGVAEPDLDPNDLQAAWGLGVHIAGSVASASSLPQIGDLIAVTGKLHRGDWAGEKVPMLEPDQITIESGALPGAAGGQTCSVDDDCVDFLICDRVSMKCSEPPQKIEWASEWHDVNGACDADVDCPPGQTCTATYQIKPDGDFTPEYHREIDVGRHVCAPALGETQASLCPRVHTTADLVGGRFVQGKEVCVAGEIYVAVAANDRDTHVQLAVNEPLPYPAATARYEIFGATTENAPPYKDPAGVMLMDPMVKQKVVALGTYRYDDGHGWFEVHPVKMYWLQK